MKKKSETHPAPSYSERSRLVGTIRSPLGFFALALLIVEGLLLGAGIFFELSPLMRIVALGVGVSLFLIVFITVCWLVVKHPTHLVFSEDAHIQSEAMRLYCAGPPDRPPTAVLESIVSVQAQEPIVRQLPSTTAGS